MAPLAPGRLQRALRFLARRLADAVVYAMCASLFLLNAGTVLSVLAGRAGEATEPRLAGAARFAAIAGACLFPSAIAGIPLLATRGAAKEPSDDEAPAARRRDESKSSALRDLWAGLPRHWRAFYLSSLPSIAGQLIKTCSPVEGSSEEKLGSLLLDLGFVGMALIQACWFVPILVTEWRAAQPRSVSLKDELPV